MCKKRYFITLGKEHGERGWIYYHLPTDFEDSKSIKLREDLAWGDVDEFPKNDITEITEEEYNKLHELVLDADIETGNYINELLDKYDK